MKKFVVIYHASQKATKQLKNASPEEIKKGMEPWMVWAKKCGRGLIDLGTPLGNGRKLSKTASTPSKREVVGYSILQAEGIKEAMKMLQGHPHLAWASGCEIEVHESLSLPGV